MIKLIDFTDAADGTQVAINPEHVTAVQELENCTSLIMLAGGDSALVDMTFYSVVQLLTGETKQ